MPISCARIGGIPRVDHVNAVLERDSDDVLLREVGTNWGEPLADLVGLIRLRLS